MTLSSERFDEVLVAIADFVGLKSPYTLGSGISQPARILAAADAYQAMREPRPYRSALDAETTAEQLRSGVKAGWYDAETVEAVLGAAGHRITAAVKGRQA